MEGMIMAEKVLMPKAGITVEECVITEWIKQVGDTVEVGDILFNYETDKATFECESTASGVILAILKEEGDEVPVLEAVCVVGSPGEKYTLDEPEADTSVNTNTKINMITNVNIDANPKLENVSIEQNEDYKISPRAKEAARKAGVDMTYALSSGPAGRIIERDVKQLERNRFGRGLAGVAGEAGEAEKGGEVGATINKLDYPNEYKDVKFTNMRKATAKAMMTSLSTTAQVTNQHSFDATTIINMRNRIKASGDTAGLGNITYNDMIVYAASRVIENHPNLNAHVVDNNIIRQFENVHIGVAVDTPKGLYVPVVRNANKLSLDEIAVEIRRLATLCLEGKVTADLFAEATFTISNLGALGVEMFTPVINPPQTGILGVCGITTKVREVNGELQGYQSMNLALTYDHCVVDGWPASMFLKELCQAMENFDLLLLNDLK